jgi:hypothetical protein
LGEVVGAFGNEHVNALPAVAVIYQFPGMTAAGYRDVMRHVAFGAVPAAAPRVHIAAVTEEEIFVLAVWESEAPFRSAEPALQAAFAAAGVGPVAPVLGAIHRVGISPGDGRSAHA